MYKTDKLKGALIWGGSILAFGICAALVTFLVWTLHLRTEYRAVCLEINDAVLAARSAEVLVSQNGDSYPADDTLIDYYDRFLLDRNTAVYSRRARETTAKTITLTFPRSELSLTPVDNDSAVALRWDTQDGTRTYLVRNSESTCRQLNAYFSNYKNRLEAAG